MSFIVVVAVALFSSWYGRFCCCCYADCLLASQPAIFCMKAYSGLFCSEVPRFVLYLLSYRGEKKSNNNNKLVILVFPWYLLLLLLLAYWMVLIVVVTAVVVWNELVLLLTFCSPYSEQLPCVVGESLSILIILVGRSLRWTVSQSFGCLRCSCCFCCCCCCSCLLI